MRSKAELTGQNRPTFVEEARRAQIIETAIRTIADRGFSQASMAEIAKGAGCSRGVISYHFAGKDDLVEEILSRLLREPAEFIKHRVDACDSAVEKLQAYVRAYFEFVKAQRNQTVALVELWSSRVSPQVTNRFNADAYEPSRHYISRILEIGQEAGEVRALPNRTLASVLQAAIDGVIFQWVFDPQAVDLDACAEEILGMVTKHVDGRTAASQEG